MKVKELKKLPPWIVVIAGTMVVVVMLMGGFGAYNYYQGHIFPGTRVGLINVGGLTVEQAERVLEKQLETNRQVTLGWGRNRYSLELAQLGVVFNPRLTAQQALANNNSWSVSETIRQLVTRRGGGKQVEPIFTLDENSLNEAMASIAAQIEIPAQEPQIIIEEGHTIKVLTGENGQEVDEQELQQRIVVWIRNLAEEQIEIPVRLLKPKLSDQQAQQVFTRATNLLEKKIEVELVSEGLKWEVTDEQIISWMDLQTHGWETGKIQEWIHELATSVDRPAQNASFRVLGTNRVEEFKPEKPGLAVEQEKLLNQLIARLNQVEAGEVAGRVEVETRMTDPEVTAAQINNLGIKELVGKGESWYAGSITNRIFNLKKAAEALNGVLLAPGEKFSFNATVGEISTATGYKPAYIIKEGKTILGDGGGVCQTSSTLFRAVLAAGLPIDERTAHAYRVSYYEQNYQPGFDATVFQPAPDFKFVNDTPGHLLIQTVFDEQKKYLAFELYGTADGRKVELSKARIWDVVSPPPDLYIDDPTLPVGEIRQTEHAARGAKVAFDWKVTRGEEVLQERTFYSNYRAWQGVYLRGTKTQ